MVLSSVKRKRGRPKGSKNKPIDVSASSRLRYRLKSRIEKDALGADQCYYFIHDLKRGATYPEIIARFTVELEAKSCTEFLNGTRKISKRMYEKKRICVL